MNDDDVKVVERLRMLIGNIAIPHEGDDERIGDAIDLIERLTATVERLKSQNAAIRGKNAALRAEVERLTPRKMTLQEACDVLNDLQHGGHCLWCVVGDGVVGPGPHEFLTEKEVRYIAQGLLRDAAPQEPEGGR